MFYQNSQKRVYYNDQLQKHTQFNNEYIYAFTWEDPRVDHRLLKIRDDDVVLCITSAGDNVLDYLYQASPRRVHAVDLNPNQNHLLELKVAALQSLPYLQVWKMFGEGRLSNFRKILMSKLSPHLSSQACQYWLSHTSAFDSAHGLYETGAQGTPLLPRQKSPLTPLQACYQAHTMALLATGPTIRSQRAVQCKDPKRTARNLATDPTGSA